MASEGRGVTERASGGRTWFGARSAALGTPIAPTIAPERDQAATLLSRLHVVAVALVLAAVVVVGLHFRLIAVDQLSLQIDEPASLLGALAVAEHGVPILPSGTLYLHGATLSYLLAPLVWLGIDDIRDLPTLRLVNAVIGTLAIVLTFRLGQVATGQRWVALGAALLVAIDPVSVQWSAHLRMYALLQVLTLAIVLVFLLAMKDGDQVPILLVTLFLLASFTHVGAALLWPPMVLVALLVHGRTLLGPNQRLGLGLVLCLLGPVLILVLNQAFAPAGRTGTAGLFGSILDENTFLQLERFLQPSLWGWRWLFGDNWYSGLMPALLTILSGIVLSRYLLTEHLPHGEDAVRRPVGALLAFHWIPVLLLGLLTTERQPRYTLNIYPLGLILALLALSVLMHAGRRTRQNRLRGSWALYLATGLAAAVIVLNLGQGLHVRLLNPTVEPDYGDTLAFVAQHRTEDEIVISAMTPPAYLALGGENLAFLAGVAGSPRVASYTHHTANGRLVDYWVGADAIASVDTLCATLAQNPGGWVLIDTTRFWYSPALRGEVATVLRATTTEVHRGDMGSLVFRINPTESWGAATACRQR